MSYILLKSPYFKDWILLNIWQTPLTNYNWLSQNIYITFLVFFYMHFLDMQVHFPKMKRFFKNFLLISLGVSITVFMLDILGYSEKLSRRFFLNIFVPVLIIFTVFAFYFAYKTPKKLGYFVITGILFYNVFAYLSLYKSIFASEPESIKYFYIGILLESIVFMFGLGYKIKLIYVDKLNIQKKIILEQRENQLLKENYQKELQKELAKKEYELVVIAEKAEEERVAKLKSDFENELQALHLASLQSQMNPHFIFNALNSIKVFLIENDKEKAVYYLNKFSKLIRKILESSRVESHSLEEELEIITLYHSIENIRFDEGIQFTIQKDPKVLISSLKVPPLLLQPFVENAIWHGLMLSKKEKKIIIKVYKENDVVNLSLIDNGIGREKSIELKNKKSYKKDSVGLKMTSERLSYFNQKQKLNYSFEFIDRKDGKGNPEGTEVQFLFS